MNPKTCTICNGEFLPNSNKQKYCTECRQTASLSRNRSKKFRQLLQGLSDAEKLQKVEEIRTARKEAKKVKAVATTKTCGGCNQTKPRDEFWGNAATVDGLQTRCKACQNKQQYLDYQQKRAQVEAKQESARIARMKRHEAELKRKAEQNDADLGYVRETVGTYAQPARVATICCPECGRKQEKNGDTVLQMPVVSDFGGSLMNLQQEVGVWGLVTFPNATNGSITEHLQEEVKEIANATTSTEMAEECADAYLMLLHLAHRNGFDLETEARKKFEVVRHAKWVDDGRGYKKRVKE